MSVINSMLKDLDKRQQPHSLENLNVAPVQYQGKPVSKLPWILLALVSLLLIIGGTYSWKQLSDAQLLQAAPAEKVAVIPAKLEPVKMAASQESGTEVRSPDELDVIEVAEPQEKPNSSVKQAEHASESLVAVKAVVEPEVLPAQSDRAGMKDDMNASPVTPEVVYTAQPKEVIVKPLVSRPVEAQPDAPKARPRVSSMAVTEVQVSNEQLAQRRYSLATKAEEQGLLSDAIVYYSEVLALTPDMHKARRQLAALYYGQNRLGLASDTLVKGVALFPLEYDYALLLARVKQAAGDNKQALASLAQIPDGNPRDIQKWTLQSSLAQSIGEHQLSAESYRKLLIVEPEQAKWWMGLGYALDAQQAYLPAVQAYQQALTLRGLSRQAKDYIENRLVQLGESE